MAVSAFYGGARIKTHDSPNLQSVTQDVAFESTFSKKFRIKKIRSLRITIKYSMGSKKFSGKKWRIDINQHKGLRICVGLVFIPGIQEAKIFH
jgi:hypothetical protein